MNKCLAIGLFMVVFAYVCLPARASDLSAPDTAVAVRLRLQLSTGWWISINQNGSGAFGLGTMSDRVKITEGTFAFTDVLDSIQRIFARKPKTAEHPYMSVSFFKERASSDQE